MKSAELRAATKRFGAVTALRDVDLEVRPGELLAVLGPNGAGKTTAVRLMLGLSAPDSGAARLFGMHPRERAARQRTGVMLHGAKMPDTLRAGEQIRLFSSYYPRPLAFGEVLKAAGLDGLENRQCGKLSQGQRQRVAFALSICGNPDLVFLDEPTVGLDVESRRSFWSSIRSLVGRGGSVLLTTHHLEEADALADRIVLINRGRVIAEGTPSEIKARAASSRIRCVTHGQRLEILTGEPERVVRELLSRDPHLTGLEVTASGLEEAFLTLTGNDDARISA